MKPDFTRIAIVLDRSGSMESVREATITGFNKFIDEQKKLPGECKVRVIGFDDRYEVWYDEPVALIPEMTAAIYVPRNSTALLDAQGRTIEELGEELSALPEDQRPSKVIVVTMTDGLENASEKFKPCHVRPGEDPNLDGRKRLADMIARQRDIYKWEFVFLGANQDAIQTAAAMNIPAGAAITYNSNAASVQNVMHVASAYVGEVRSRGFSSFSDEDRVKAMVEDKPVIVP